MGAADGPVVTNVGRTHGSAPTNILVARGHGFLGGPGNWRRGDECGADTWVRPYEDWPVGVNLLRLGGRFHRFIAQNLSNLQGNGIPRERLLNERCAGVQHPVVHDGVVRITRHVEHLKVG